MSSSGDNIVEQNVFLSYSNFRDASDYTLFKKRKAVGQLLGSDNILQAQTLQNKTSYSFSVIQCSRVNSCQGPYPGSLRLILPTYN